MAGRGSESAKPEAAKTMRSEPSASSCRCFGAALVLIDQGLGNRDLGKRDLGKRDLDWSGSWCNWH